MKALNFLSIICLVLLFACNNTPQRPESILPENYTPPPTATAPAAATPGAEPPQNAEGVWHYTCPNGCEGGGGGATACTVCGTTLAHNTAYHASTSVNSGATNPTTITSPSAIPSPGNTLNPTIVPPPTQATPEPPQNAAGIWHYTCSNGCAGGAGSATACSACGSTLAHNTAYHN